MSIINFSIKLYSSHFIFDNLSCLNQNEATQVPPTQLDYSTIRPCPPDLTDALKTELVHRKQQKVVDYVGLINNLRIQPTKKSRLLVPLCRMIPMDRVRPIGDVDVQRLENEFVNGYRDGDRVLYISIFNNEEKSKDVTETDKTKWSPHWQRVNDEFEADLQKDEDLKDLRGKMFYVWDGNHRHTAWMRHINNHHADDPEWHLTVHCIILDPRDQVGNLLNAMNDVNW